jgi:transcription antitermination factor NusG
MPILKQENEIFPDNLFDLPISGAPWEIAHLRSRQEKTVARVLLDGGIPFYLPQIKQTTKRSGRSMVSHLPLFPGYIFLRRAKGLRETLWRTSAIANMIEVPDQSELTKELVQIRKLQSSGAFLTSRKDLVPGDTVHITDGVFTGYTGCVVEERGSLRLVVSVSILKSFVAIEFPRELLSPLKLAQARDRRRM